MELFIKDVDYDSETDNTNDSIPILNNNVPINVIKKDNKSVRFMPEQEKQGQGQEDPKNKPNKYTKMIRKQPVHIPKPQITYDDILAKMGMFVSNGKLHLLDENIPQHTNTNSSYNSNTNNNYNSNYNSNNNYNTNNNQFTQRKYEPNPNIPQNSYIYNKYFKDTNVKPEIRRPKTIAEYRAMIIQDIIQRRKIKQIKSVKLKIPTMHNMNVILGQSNPNKLFDFSKR
jgi:hypothetical protein